MPLEETVALGIASASRWLKRYFLNPDRLAISDTELRLLLCWLLNRSRPETSGHRDHVPTDEAIPLDRFELTPNRVHDAIVSIPNTMACRILCELETLSTVSGIQFDPATLNDDRRFVRDKLVDSFQAEQHVARREILLQLIEQGEYAVISTLSDFWSDFLCFDIELACLLEPDLGRAVHLDAYSRLVDLLLFKYISLRDVDRLCPVLRAARYISPTPSDLYAQGIGFVSNHCFDRGGAVAHAAAFHFSKSKSGAELDSQVVLKTTVSTLVTLAGFSGVEPPRAQARDAKPALAATASPAYSTPEKSSATDPHGSARDYDTSADVAAAEARAIRWIESSLDSFDPFSYGDSDKFEFSIKMLAELSFVCAAYHGNTGNPNRASVETLRRTIFDRALSRPDLWSFLLQNLSALPGFSIYASMLECGFLDDELHRKLRSFCGQPNIVHGEYAPALFMDIAHSVIRCGFAWAGPSISTLYERSLLASRPNLLGLKDPDYYTITHTIFFVTDFGRHPEQLPRNVRTFFANELDNMTFFFATRENWDLLGEILLCQIYLNLDNTAGFSRYMRLLLSTQNSDGSFISELSAKGDEEAKTNSWSDLLDKYHTTLVFLLLAVAEKNTAAAASPALALL
jgi:hypothetical protein